MLATVATVASILCRRGNNCTYMYIHVPSTQFSYQLKTFAAARRPNNRNRKYNINNAIANGFVYLNPDKGTMMPALTTDNKRVAKEIVSIRSGCKVIGPPAFIVATVNPKPKPHKVSNILPA